jgi:CubicO group peptidase (beta-lactamase class C family)
MKTKGRTSLTLIILLMTYLVTGQVSSSQEIHPESRRFSKKALDRFIMSEVDSLQITGLSVAVIEKGRVVYYRCTGEKNIETHEKVDKRTLFEAASMTKPVFAYAVHKLVAEGRFDIDTPLFRYSPYEDLEYDDRYKLITGRMVLGHTTGLPNWRPKGERLAFNADPGSQYIYSGEGYEFLGYAVSRHTGEDLNDIIREEVLAPLGMKHSFMTDNDYVTKNMSTGHTDNKVTGRKILDRAYVAYGLRTEARDYAKFVIELMKESRVPGSTFSRMASPHTNIDDSVISCLGIRSQQTPDGVKFFHSGNNGNRFQSHFAFYKDRDMGFVFFMNCNKGVEFAGRLNDFLLNEK